MIRGQIGRDDLTRQAVNRQLHDPGLRFGVHWQVPPKPVHQANRQSSSYMGGDIFGRSGLRDAYFR